MASGILETEQLSADAAAMVDMIKRSAQRGADVVKQVLTFVRGSDGRRVPLNLDYILKEICKVARETFPKNIEIRCKVQKDLSLVRGDPTQLHQVLMNLCVNARDAMPDGGHLTLVARNAVEPGGRCVVMEVEDTGTGIPESLIDKIFDPFFHHEGSVKRNRSWAFHRARHCKESWRHFKGGDQRTRWHQVPNLPSAGR
jgi:signal transduction histidine kinase